MIFWCFLVGVVWIGRNTDEVGVAFIGILSGDMWAEK